jgi:Flp pilus assembly protein TadD
MVGVLMAAWLRALDAVAGRTVYTLAAFVSAGVVGLAIGGTAGLLAGRRSRRPFVFLGVVAVVLALLLACEPVLFSGIVSGWQRLLMDTGRTFRDYLLTLVKTSAILVGGPCLLIGLAVPVYGRAVRGAAGARRWRAAALACVLALAAGAVSGRLLVPALGFELLLRLSALWFGALVSLGIVCGERRSLMARAALAVVPLAAVVALAVTFAPSGRSTVLSEGAFGRLAHRDSGFAQGHPLFCQVSRLQVTAAYADPDYQFVFTVDGRPLLFGNRFHTARTLTGYVPLLARPACRKAAVVGPEAGLYLPFLVRGGVANVGVCGAERVAVNLAIAADAYLTGDGACEGASVTWDAPLAFGSGYDVILVAPAPSWQRGSARLYGKRRLLRYKRALSPDGVVVLHVDARALSAGRFASVARDFASVYGGVQVWCTGVFDWVLVGSASPVKAPLDDMLALFEREPFFRDFARAGGLALPDALACVLCEGQGLAGWLRSAGSESAWSAAWRSPRAAVEVTRTTLQPGALESCRQKKADWVLPGQTDVDLYVSFMDKVGRALGARAAVVAALTQTALGHNDAGLASARAAAQASPHDALLVQSAESVELEGRRRLKIGDMKGALKCYENLLSFAAQTARAHYGMGYCLRGNGDNENAYLHFARAVSDAPEQTAYRFELAQSALTIGEFAEADRQFREVLKREPGNAEALFRFAKGLAMRERPDKDFPQAIALAERACTLTGWENSDYAYGLADLYMEAGRVLEGLGLKRKLKEGGKPSSSVTR